MRYCPGGQNGLSLLLMLALAGCTIAPVSRPPSPVEARPPPPVISSPAPWIPAPEVEQAPVPAPEYRESTPAPESRSPAVVALLAQAGEASGAGNIDGAAASLERALRIEPRNARLWSELAAIRLRQQQYHQAEQTASKSNALAPGDRLLQQRNWRLIEMSREARGDSSGAAQARGKAAAL